MSPKKLRFALVALGFSLGECGNHPARPVTDEITGHDPHANPVFECPTSTIVEPGNGYPHPIQQFPVSTQPERSVAQLREFCARMTERFSTPNLSRAEALRVYAEIPKVLTIADGSYGTPDPSAPLPPPVNLPDRVRLRRIGVDRYELFYFTIECGRNYRHYEITLTPSSPVLRELETWSEAFPC